MSKKGKVLVAMSGGIDSTVAAILLHNEGYEVVGITMKTWDYSTSNANGKETEVHGDGVVGEQPQLAPGSSYSYTSGAVLETPVGTMQGHYEMQAADQRAFNAPIPLFRLAMPNILN
mgnify:CR=1 FL=1